MAGLARREKFEMPEPFRRFLEGDWESPALKVEEFRDGNTLVVKAEIPGIDPDRNVDISVTDGILHIQAEREEKTEEKTKDGYHSEFRYGSFSRDIALPAGSHEEDVTATYHEGVLEVRVPLPERSQTASKIPITRA